MLPVSVVGDESTGEENWKRKYFLFLFGSPTSRFSRFYIYYIDSLVLLSLLFLLISTFPTLFSNPKWHNYYFIIESFISLNFAIDLLLKISLSTNFSYLNSVEMFVNFSSIIPWFFDLFISSPKGDWEFLPFGLQILKLARFIRLFYSILKKFPEMIMFATAVKKSRTGLLFLLFYVFGFGVLSSFILFLAEISECKFDPSRKLWVLKVDQNLLCHLQNSWDSIWLVFVTMTTVGYGDLSPKSSIGKIITIFIMFISNVCFSLPIIIFGVNLTELYLEDRIKLSTAEKRKSIASSLILSGNEESLQEVLNKLEKKMDVNAHKIDLLFNLTVETKS